MSHASCSWPHWLGATRIDDASLGAAYEATPAAQRAALKTGLALGHMHFGQSLGTVFTRRSDRHLGFWRQEQRMPAHWALVCISPSYSAAARLAAACLPALLADVPLLGVACVGGKPQPSALVCLELCGVEDIFALEIDAGIKLLQSLPGNRGRLVLLHSGELTQLAHLARDLRIPCFEEAAPPRLLLKDPAAFDAALLDFAHGSPVPAAPSEGAADETTMADAMYMVKPSLATPADGPSTAATLPPLVLTPGCEGFWLHQGLTPDFFTLVQRSFGPLPLPPLYL